MEPLVLNAAELRILGSLIEKQITTPDLYPLTLNSLRNACNQTSNRDPILLLDEPTLLRALDSLREKRLAYVFDGAGARSLKYQHRIEEALSLNEAELAALCVLILRGPQTVGEIRTRSGRLHEFTSLDEVESTLNLLAAKTPQPLVLKLPRQPGYKESRYAHLLGGEITPEQLEAKPRTEPIPITLNIDDERIAKLENLVQDLRSEMQDLQQQFTEFRKQFE